MLIFQKTLAETDVQRRLTIPTAAFHHFEIAQGDSQNVVVKDSMTGNVWVFCCCTRSNGVYPKPEIRAGWLDFVRAKGLRSGDRVAFYKEEDYASGAGYRIQTKRLTTILGRQLWGEISN